ncbi:MAG: MFS transporter, partial [Mycetocola sp.]
GQAMLGFALGVYFGPAGSAFVELFPARVRYSGASISYNLAFTIFGGTAPLLSLALISATGITIAPAWYVVAVAVLALLVIARMPETNRRSMQPDEFEASVAAESNDRVAVTS